MKVAVVFLACGLLSLAQAPALPEFEVASIKPAPPQEIGRISTHLSSYTSDDGRKGTLKYTGVSVKDLIKQAYKVQSYQVSGGPSWIDSDRFDIDAVIPAGVRNDRISLLLQNLLADRFQFASHRETRQLSEYALTVGKNGSKMKPAPDGNDDISSKSNNARWSVKANSTLAHLAEFLSQQLGRPVVDETGLNGSYEFTLEWTGETADAVAADAPPSLFTAVQEQLGLKLESRRGPVDVIVVDGIERPSGN